jgi:hypothetical protein
MQGLSSGLSAETGADSAYNAQKAREIRRQRGIFGSPGMLNEFPTQSRQSCAVWFA